MSDQMVVELTKADIYRRLESGARERRGLSAHDLLQQYRAGTLAEPCEVVDLLALAGLLRDDDPLFVAA